MQLARTGSKNYAFLPSGILIVNPDPSLLAARAQLLNAAEHYVATGSEYVAQTDLCSVEVRVAILSQTLERATLETLAKEIRDYRALSVSAACVLPVYNQENASAYLALEARPALRYRFCIPGIARSLFPHGGRGTGIEQQS